MAVNFDNDITSRIERQRKQQMADFMGKTVEQMEEDSEYFNEIKAIEIEDKYASDQEAAEEAAEMEEWAAYKPEKSGPQPESEAARNARLEGEAQAMRFSPGLEISTEDKEALQNRYLPGAGQSPQYMGEAPPGEEGPAGIPAQMDPFVEKEMGRQALQEEAAPQFSRYETPEQGEVTEPGLMERGMSALKEKFPTLRSQGEVEAGLREKAERQGTGLTDAWQDDPNIQDEMIKRETTATGSDIEGKDNEGFMPDSPEALAAAGEQSDIQRDENEPAVKQMKEVQDKPEARKELFKDMSKEDTAMAKEELGNYYIGPGGYAINLNTLEASRERAVNMSLLQFVPDHAKAQMLASWGYIDQEDVDNMPDSPAYMVEELKGVNANALQKLKNKKDITITDKNISGRDALATKLYTSKAEINAANNTLTETLENRKIDVRELELDASIFMHGDKLDMQQYIADNKLDLSREELQQLDTHFTKKLSFEYSQTFLNDDYRNRVVDQSDAQFNRKFDRLDKQDQEAMIMAEFNRAQKTVEMYIDSGQFNSAVLASAGMPSRLVGFNYKTYYKNKAKTSGTDPIFTTAMGMSDNLVGYMASSGKDVKKLRDEYYNRQDALTTQLMKEGDPSMGEPSYMDKQMLELGMVQFNDLPEKSVKTSKGKTITAGKDEYNNNRMQYRSAMRIKIFDKLMKKDPVYGQLYNNINNARTHYQTKGSLDTFGGGKTTPKPGPKTTPEVKPKVIEKPKVEGVKTEVQEEVEKKLTSASKVFKNELARGDQEYKAKFLSWLRSPSSEMEALKAGEKDLGFGMRKYLKRELGLDGIQELLDQPKELVHYFKTNMRHYKKLSPEAKFYIAQQDANFNSGIDK